MCSGQEIQIRLMAAQPDNWQATTIGKSYVLPIFMHYFNRSRVCIIGPVIFHLLGSLYSDLNFGSYNRAICGEASGRERTEWEREHMNIT